MNHECALSVDGRVAIVTLNRPAARNALSRALMRELTRTARELSERSDIDVVLLTGAGSAFSAGADLNDANAKGLPKQPWGRVEVTFAPSNPKQVYAFVENVRSALYVSQDGGRSFEERDRS